MALGQISRPRETNPCAVEGNFMPLEGQWSHLSRRRSHSQGMSAWLSPIPMTTVAALLGSVPLMLGTGQGRNFGSPSAMGLSAACSSRSC